MGEVELEPEVLAWYVTSTTRRTRSSMGEQDALRRGIVRRRSVEGSDEPIARSAKILDRTRHDGGVAVAHVEIVDGKARYEGRTLAQWVPDVVDRIAQRCEPLRVILFGSVARGDDGPDSDIDLLVVLREVRRRHDAAVAVLREIRDLPVPVDVLVADPSILEREAAVPGMIRVALREGRVVLAGAA